MDSADSDPAIVELARGFYALMNLGGSYPPMDSVDSDSAITNLVDEFRTRMNLDGTDSPMDSADVDLVLSFMPSDLIDDISIPPEGSDTSCTPSNDTLVHAKGNDTDTSKSYEEWESDFRDILKDHPIVDSKGPRTICTLVCNSEKYFKIDWFPDYLSFKDIRSNTSKELAMIYRLSGDYLFQFPETGQYLAMDEWLLPTVCDSALPHPRYPHLITTNRSEGCKFEFLDKTYYWKTHETSIKVRGIGIFGRSNRSLTKPR